MPEDFSYTPDLISVSDEDGKEYVFEVLDRVETDDGRYVAVVDYFENPEEMLEDDGEVIILKVSEEDGESFLSQIEDENEFVEVSEIFEERLAALFEYDEDEESDADINEA